MTREEAIKQLKGDITENCATFSNQWEKDEEAISMAISALENKGEWIPTSERLPEDIKYELVTNGLDIFTAWYNPKHNPKKERFKGWHSFDEHFDLQTPILAWQPLPEPYKADREVSE